ncbi:hypothetical protein [Thalassococcus lentus]|uniref:Uncharacterized protein n=1 Tax=Thalassococcus lentus TaxID=1210524 RepID=A0ABT4XP72_9RHOB|nr:hypothetical protein [Thalassococcus lentus]MDA7423725.1 hypothetical protein [Thalassococcus lentus]
MIRFTFALMLISALTAGTLQTLRTAVDQSPQIIAVDTESLKKFLESEKPKSGQLRSSSKILLVSG